MRKQRSFLSFLVVFSFLLMLVFSLSASAAVIVAADQHNVVTSMVAESPPAAVLVECNDNVMTMILASNGEQDRAELSDSFRAGSTSVKAMARSQISASSRERKGQLTQAFLLGEG